MLYGMFLFTVLQGTRYKAILCNPEENYYFRTRNKMSIFCLHLILDCSSLVIHMDPATCFTGEKKKKIV
jgi:hypothetical protein